MLTVLTVVHTALSLVGLAVGIPVVIGLMRTGTIPEGGVLAGPGPLRLFLILAVTATLTGFVFPFNGVTPAFATGIVSTLVFLVMLAAYLMRSTGFWHHVWRLGLVITIYLLVFVTVAQAFLKIPPLKALAPTGTEPPFAIAQVIGLGVFVWIGVVVLRRARRI
jgi:hypothetical protein